MFLFKYTIYRIVPIIKQFVTNINRKRFYDSYCLKNVITKGVIKEC